MDLKECFELKDGRVALIDADKFRENIDTLAYKAVFTEDEDKKNALLTIIKEGCKEAGVIPASIQGLYDDMGRDYPGFTVPAINIRGLTYDTAKAIFRQAMKMDVGALIFEIARSEIGYTGQRPLEYSTMVLAAALKEGFKHPVFIQGDHFQLIRKYYASDPKAETTYMRGLIKEAIEAEFYNIDLDTSTLVDLEQETLKEQQRPNFQPAADLTAYIREIEPQGVTVSVGGEIGEIGKKNSTTDELKAYLDGYAEVLAPGLKGLSKLSVQTGTSHGGVVLPDGTLAKVDIDFDTLTQLSSLARKEFGLSGCVQHGASTLPEDAFDMFPKTGTSEIHLATGFQNIMYDSTAMPAKFKVEAYDYIKKKFGKEKKDTQTEEQFLYSTRKKAFGPLKKKWWDLPPEARGAMMDELEEKFQHLFTKLKVGGTIDIVNKTVKPIKVQTALPDAAKKLLS